MHAFPSGTCSLGSTSIRIHKGVKQEMGYNLLNQQQRTKCWPRIKPLWLETVLTRVARPRGPKSTSVIPWSLVSQNQRTPPMKKEKTHGEFLGRIPHWRSPWILPKDTLGDFRKHLGMPLDSFPRRVAGPEALLSSW